MGDAPQPEAAWRDASTRTGVFRPAALWSCVSSEPVERPARVAEDGCRGWEQPREALPIDDEPGRAARPRDREVAGLRESPELFDALPRAVGHRVGDVPRRRDADPDGRDRAEPVARLW